MKRTPLGRGSKPLTRKAPIASGDKQLTRTKPKNTRAPIARATRPTRAPRAPKSTGPSQDTRALVHARDGGRCVRCGKPARDLDHRRGRGAGGTHGELSDTINGPGWLLTLCGMGNAGDGCHRDKDHDRDAFERDGYAIPRNGVFVNAEKVPVRTRAGWALFLNDGTRVPCPPPPDDDARKLWAA